MYTAVNKNYQGKLKRWIYVLVMVSALMLAVRAETAEGPKIKIDKTYWDFGRVEEGSIKEKTFQVENRGDEDLIIEDIYTSCGCTTFEISSYQIKPKENADLKVTYNTKGKAEGKDSKSIYIISNDSDNPKTKITIAAESVAKEPRPLESDFLSIPTITSEQLQARLAKGEKITILDVREENEYIERHIPQAIWFPKSKFDKGDQKLEEILKKIDKQEFMVAYCGAGHRSSYITRKLRQRGYNIYNLEGISFWEAKGYPLIRGPKLLASLEPSIIHLEEAYEHYYTLFKDTVWIDVRNKNAYQKGHVKGALGIPLSELEDNLYRIPKDKEIVLYCEGTWDGGKCDASISAGRILIKNGFKQGKIKVFEEGFGAWENAGYPVEKKDKFANFVLADVKTDIYSKLQCLCCKKELTKAVCRHSKEVKAYIDALIDMGLGEEEILIKAAKKYSLEVIIDKKTRKNIENKLIKEAGSRRPQIFIQPLTYNLGKISKSKDKLELKLALKNKGKGVLKITDLKTSCGCTTAKLKTKKAQSPAFGNKGVEPGWEMDVASGEVAQLIIITDLNHPHVQLGKMVRTVSIKSNDPVHSLVEVKFEAEIVE